MPGQNDYHITTDGILQPGLGKDEPTEEARAGLKAAGLTRLTALKEELALAGAQLTERERSLLIREQAIEAKERAAQAADVRKASVAARLTPVAKGTDTTTDVPASL